jgi:hypothetical protein
MEYPSTFNPCNWDCIAVVRVHHENHPCLARDTFHRICTAATGSSPRRNWGSATHSEPPDYTYFIVRLQTPKSARRFVLEMNHFRLAPVLQTSGYHLTAFLLIDPEVGGQF